MSSILTNNGAMVALQTLKNVNRSLEATQNEIATGKSVANSKDNAALWSISKVMESDVKGFKGISESLSLGQSTLEVAREASETVTNLLTDIKGKIVAAQEENVNRETIQDDIDALRDQITSVVNAAQFNGLNLVQGTDDVNILSSLDRDAAGNVTARDITVQRQDLSTNAGVYGAGGVNLGANITASAAAVDSTGVANQLELTFAGTATDNWELNINGNAVSVTADGTAAATTVTDMAAAINALGLTGVTAVDNGATLELINTNSFDQFAVSWDTSGANTVAITNNGDTTENAGAAAGAGNATLVYRAEEVALSDVAQVNDGDSYRITVNGNDYDYIAGQGETMQDVARGLQAAIDGGGETGVTTSVIQDGGQWVVLVDYDGTDPVAGATMTLADDGESNGTASGGLFGLDNIDVTTDAGADAALNNIETLIQNSIDASASFGSDQGRIQTQSDFISGLSDSLTSGIGALVDADMEAASARLQALQVQQQLATQSLTIANQAPQNILALFR